MIKKQTIYNLLKQFNLNLNLTNIILNKEIIGEYTDYDIKYNEENEKLYVFEGGGYFPNYDPNFFAKVPEGLLQQGEHWENCRVTINPQNKWQYVTVEHWREGDILSLVIYNDLNEEVGRS
ncbi:MAG: hypothetical protein E7Z86_10340 [Methanosphaera stadtmanae]|nr:hypothetical protein [Methanosphaera stadtmanae]